MIKERYMSSGRNFIICGSKQATNQKEIALAAILPTPFILMAIAKLSHCPFGGHAIIDLLEIKLKDIKSLYRVSEDESKIITDCLLVLQKSFASPSGEHGS